METAYRKPLGAALVGALALLIVALAVLVPFRVFAQDSPETLTKIGDGLAAVNFNEDTLGEIGDYSYKHSGGSTVTYSLSGTHNSDFDIISDEGGDDAGKVYNKNVFDFENPFARTFEFTVEATAGGVSESFPVTVTVTNLNDRPEFGAAVYECYFDEQADAGTPCTPTPVAGPDPEGDSLTYALSDASILSSYLHVDPRTGIVRISDEGAGKLDADVMGSAEFSVSIWVTDSEDIDGNPESGTIGDGIEVDDRAVIRVIVNAVEDEAPHLTLWGGAQQKSESLRVVWTTSREKALEYRVQYRATGETAWDEHDFSDDSDGELTRDGAHRYYTEIDGLYAATEYEMRYCIGDGCTDWTKGNSVSTHAEPNAKAEITGTSRSLTIFENTDPSDLAENFIGRVYGHSGRGDTAGQNELRYWLEGPGAEKFSVERWSYTDTETGEVSVYMDAIIRATQSLDYETASSYTLTVHASDGRENGALDENRVLDNPNAGAKDPEFRRHRANHHHGDQRPGAPRSPGAAGHGAGPGQRPGGLGYPRFR